MLKNFITFEGGEGCGKTTQIRLLSEYFDSVGINHLKTREPGGTALGEKLRDAMLDAEELQDATTEYLLITAARKHHLDTVIVPALDAGKLVICDRFTDSTLAYQCYMKGMDLWMFERLNDMLLHGMVPSLTIYLDLDPAAGLARIANRQGAHNIYDKKGLDFHTKLRESYLKIVSNHPNRIVKIDADDDASQVHSFVLNALKLHGLIEGE